MKVYVIVEWEFIKYISSNGWESEIHDEGYFTSIKDAQKYLETNYANWVKRNETTYFITTDHHFEIEELKCLSVNY